MNLKTIGRAVSQRGILRVFFHMLYGINSVCYTYFHILKNHIFKTINEHKSEAIVKMHERELSDHSQKGRLFPAILGKVKNK